MTEYVVSSSGAQVRLQSRQCIKTRSKRPLQNEMLAVFRWLEFVVRAPTEATKIVF
jgi:hypothetical protein